MTLDLKKIQKSGRSHLMGILNITPDSFYDGNSYIKPDSAFLQANALVEAGADIIDIGCESTRPPQVYHPNSPPHSFQITEEEEMRRLIPVLERLKGALPVPMSIDTIKPNVARYACKMGVEMINDVMGFRDPLMRRVAAETGVAICIVHMQGTPATMQINPTYPVNVIQSICSFFEEQIVLLTKEGVEKNNICLDPGIGFGKTVAHNVEILQNLQEFRYLGYPLLFGTSRKVFLGKIVNRPTRELLPATLGINTLLMEQGVELLRVHDVAAHNDLRHVVETMRKPTPVL